MADKKPKTFEGVCHLWSETGTEGGYWALQDSKFIKKVDDKEKWSYDGLHVLKDGDWLTIFNKENPKLVAWAGIISLKPRTSFETNVRGWRVHSTPINCDQEKWAEYFFEEYPAELIPMDKK